MISYIDKSRYKRGGMLVIAIYLMIALAIFATGILAMYRDKIYYAKRFIGFTNTKEYFEQFKTALNLARVGLVGEHDIYPSTDYGIDLQAGFRDLSTMESLTFYNVASRVFESEDDPAIQEWLNSLPTDVSVGVSPARLESSENIEYNLDPSKGPSITFQKTFRISYSISLAGKHDTITKEILLKGKIYLDYLEKYFSEKLFKESFANTLYAASQLPMNEIAALEYCLDPSTSKIYVLDDDYLELWWENQEDSKDITFPLIVKMGDIYVKLKTRKGEEKRYKIKLYTFSELNISYDITSNASAEVLNYTPRKRYATGDGYLYSADANIRVEFSTPSVRTHSKLDVKMVNYDIRIANSFPSSCEWVKVGEIPSGTAGGK